MPGLDGQEVIPTVAPLTPTVAVELGQTQCDPLYLVQSSLSPSQRWAPSRMRYRSQF